MARNTIVVSNDPRGRYIEGVLETGFTPKPGTAMQMTSAAPVNGRNTYKPWAKATAAKGEILILCEDDLLGKTVSDAMLDSQRIKMYAPLPGDELQILLANLAGTADDHPVAEEVIVETVTGKFLVTTGSPDRKPFILLESVTDPTSDTLCLARFTGD